LYPPFIYKEKKEMRKQERGRSSYMPSSIAVTNKGKHCNSKANCNIGIRRKKSKFKLNAYLTTKTR
jgi:hypothetical protein